MTAAGRVDQAAIAAWYGANFATLGIALPFLALWLEHRGASAAWIGIVAAAPSALALLSTPLAGVWADRLGDWRTALLLGSWSVLLGYGAWVVSLEPLVVLAVWTLTGAASMAIAPIADGACLTLDRRSIVSFGRVRAVGSIGYVLAVLLGGYLFEGAGIERFLPVLLGVAMLRVAAAHALPRLRIASASGDTPTTSAASGTPPSSSGSPQSVTPETVTPETASPQGRAPERTPPLPRGAFVAVIVGAALLNATHATYYTFGLLHWESIGIASATGARLWVVGILLEIVLMWRYRGIAARISARGCLLLAGAVSVLRWSLTSLDPPLAILFLVQSLHAVTFGLTFLAAVNIVSHRVDDALAARAQTLFATLNGGALSLAVLASGFLYERVAAGAYQAMAALALLGLLCVAASYRLERRTSRVDRTALP